jgi:hypothetical protein
MINLSSGSGARSRHRLFPKPRASKQDTCSGCCSRATLSDSHTHDLCRSLDHGAMSCGSTMNLARFVLCTGLILMRLSFSMC